MPFLGFYTRREYKEGIDAVVARAIATEAQHTLEIREHKAKYASSLSVIEAGNKREQALKTELEQLRTTSNEEYKELEKGLADIRKEIDDAKAAHAVTKEELNTARGALLIITSDMNDQLLRVGRVANKLWNAWCNRSANPKMSPKERTANNKELNDSITFLYEHTPKKVMSVAEAKKALPDTPVPVKAETTK